MCVRVCEKHEIGSRKRKKRKGQKGMIGRRHFIYVLKLTHWVYHAEFHATINMLSKKGDPCNRNVLHRFQLNRTMSSSLLT